MKSKTIEVGGTKFVFSTDDGMVVVSIIGLTGVTVVAAMTEKQSDTLGDVFKIMGGEVREHSI